MNIYACQKELVSTLTSFNYQKVLKNTLYSSFLETSGESEFNINQF